MKVNLKQIFWADAKLTKERIGCVISAFFFTVLEFIVIKLLFNTLFGIYHAQYGNYPEALVIVAQSRPFTFWLVLLCCVITFIWRVPLFKRKVVKVKEEPLYLEEIKEVEKIEDENQVDIEEVNTVIETEKTKEVKPQSKVETYYPEEEINGEG